MEKITLKPSIKEFLFKNKASLPEDLFFDAISYSESGPANERLGAISVLGSAQSKEKDDDLSYVINLVASLVKREYYSSASLKQMSPKDSFERSLKKINEILKDFFDKKDSRLDLGVFAIAGDSLYISRLGKFKVILARDGECIDVLNNLELFNKEVTDEKEFSNIISGKLKPGDKIFAYIPFRTLTSREKTLKNAFVEYGQNDFETRIAELSSKFDKFYCCGIHATMSEIKEIPIEMAGLNDEMAVSLTSVASPAEEAPINAGKEEGAEDKPKEKGEVSPDNNSDSKERQEKGMAEPTPIVTTLKVKTGLSHNIRQSMVPKHGPDVHPTIMSSEVSLAKKANVISNITSLLSKFRGFNKFNNRNRASFLVIVSGLVVIGVLTFIFLGFKNAPFGPDNQALVQIEEDIKLVQAHISQNKIRDARQLLEQSLAKIISIDSKKAESLKTQISQISSSVDKMSPVKSSLLADAGMIPGIAENSPAKIGAISDEIILVSESGKIFSLNSNRLEEIGSLDTASRYISGYNNRLAIFNGSTTLAVIEENLGVKIHQIKNEVLANGATVYADNLYTAEGNSIIRYTDALQGGSGSTVWAEGLTDELISITSDGNIYGLSKDGRLITYFKGEKKSEFDLSVTPEDDSYIWTTTDNPFTYFVRPAGGKVMILDKESGQLKTTYDISATSGVKNVFVSEGGIIWTLSNDLKIYKLEP